MQVKKHQLELDMEQWTGSRLGKEYIKAVCCHPCYLTYMQNLTKQTNQNENGFILIDTEIIVIPRGEKGEEAT